MSGRKHSCTNNSLKRKKKKKRKTLFHLETDFILRLLHGRKDGIINYADTCMCYICGNLYINGLCARECIFLFGTKLHFIEIWMKTTYLNFEGDSACNLVNLFLGTFTRIRINIPFQMSGAVRIKQIYVSIN